MPPTLNITDFQINLLKLPFTRLLRCRGNIKQKNVNVVYADYTGYTVYMFRHVYMGEMRLGKK